MAIEDEIINISDIDIGTEILNSDKLLIETSNGTKMIAFKDFVVGPDNISSVRQSQIEGNVEGEADTFYNVVTGFNILNNQTTPGLNTQYDQISGTVELGKFNFNAIANLASVSADIVTNTSAITELRAVLDNLAGVLESTSSSVLNSITLQTSACNCIVTGATGGGRGSRKSIGFTKAELDPATTNPNCTVQLNPFKLTFPGANEGFVDGSRYLIVGNLSIPTATSVDTTIAFYRDKSDGSSEGLFTKVIPKRQRAIVGFHGINSVDIMELVTINLGDSLRATSSTLIQSGKIDIFKIS